MKIGKILFTIVLFLRVTFSTEISTDKSCYDPGNVVNFQVSLDNFATINELDVTYFHLWDCVDSVTISVNSNTINWSWIAPDQDFTGYLVVVKYGDEQLEIAVDVSSDWQKFPRYGFLSKFPSMFQSQIDNIIKNLNRHHINGLQFYDWHYKHHKPLAGTPTNPDITWPDIANRTIYRETVKNYITAAHDRNMKTMAYNLLYGAFDNAASDGVSEQWRMYYDNAHQNPVMHDLPDSWASDIYVMDHTNSIWQNYIATAMGNVFKAFDFDGWHVDQLGSNGQPKYTYNGDAIWEASGFKTFLKEMDEKLSVPLVMNAVDGFGTNYIAQAPVKFLYTEVWSKTNFAGLVDVINTNRFYSANKQSVLAAYVNKNYNGNSMNTPAVLLADAVIFSRGGAHLELGEHLLCSEYFPYDNLQTSPELKTDLIKYYDFATAYENLLRDSTESILFTAICENDAELFSKSSKLNTVWVNANRKNNHDIVHFINHIGLTHLDWRDPDGTQKMPVTQYNLPVIFKADSTVKNVYLCSPDFKSIAMKPIEFSQDGIQLHFTLDSLKIWDMVLVEYEAKSTAIDNDIEQTVGFKLLPNYPNPFNGTTKICFNLNNRQAVKIKIYDNCGKCVCEKIIEPHIGYNEYAFHSENLSSGVYFYEISAGNARLTKKMILLK